MWAAFHGLRGEKVHLEVCFVRLGVVQACPRDTGGVVLMSCQFGALVARMGRVSENGQVEYRLLRDGRNFWRYMVVSDPRGWKALLARVGLTGGRQTTLLEHSALRAFPGMTVAYLKKLAALPDLAITAEERRRVVKLRDWLDLLIRKVVPAMPQAERERLLDRRCSAPRGDEHRCGPSPVMSAPDWSQELLGEAMDEEDAEEYRSALLAMHQKARLLQERLTSEPRDRGAASSSEQPGAVVEDAGIQRQPLPPLQPGEVVWSLATLKTMVPKVAGCSISRETRYHRRYRVSYPSPGGNRMTSKCFGERLPRESGCAFLLAMGVESA